MKTQNISAQNFNGKLYVVNKLSKKPAKCLLKEKSSILKLIKKEKFDLFVKQDYSKNVVNIIAATKYNSEINVKNGVSLTAKLRTYTEAAKKSVSEYKLLLNDIYQKSNERKLSLKDRIYRAIEKFLYEYGEE